MYSPQKWLDVDTAAISDNAAAVKATLGPGVALMAMVKANGYGHGFELATAAALEGGATWLGVSSPAEALQAVPFGVPVLVVGATPDRFYPAMLDAGVELTVFDAESVESLARAAAHAGRRARVHVKIDSGMNRLGAQVADLEPLRRALQDARDNVEITGVFTHFADSEAPDLEVTRRQHASFLERAEPLRQLAPDALVHAANSGAILRLPETHHDLVRLGIALYGYPPVEAGDAVAFRTAMTMLAEVTQVKEISKGDTVSYGRTWTAPRTTRVATLPVGYADGIHRWRAGTDTALVGGRRSRIIGRVTMDQVMVDVTDCDPVAKGDVAALLGDLDGNHLGADEIAAAGDTIPHEVLCATSSRAARIPRPSARSTQ
ncbi:MAG TPA: alanine racemase [Acidimicrobiales bacterium]|jgi:alanine racemase|nr:alanine racemase [Acidimicrobiales bacterium]